MLLLVLSCQQTRGPPARGFRENASLVRAAQGYTLCVASGIADSPIAT